MVALLEAEPRVVGRRSKKWIKELATRDLECRSLFQIFWSLLHNLYPGNVSCCVTRLRFFISHVLIMCER